MSASRLHPARTLTVAALGLLVAAPTPGNVGGCGESQSQIVVPRNDAGVANESPEFNYFDQGLCSNFCERLLECNHLCEALVSPPGGAQCSTCYPGASNPDPNCPSYLADAFIACVRGPHALRSSLFGTDHCPHLCNEIPVPEGSPQLQQFLTSTDPNTGTSLWDVQVCGDVIEHRSCSAGMVSGSSFSAPGNSIGGTFVVGADFPSQCSSRCQ